MASDRLSTKDGKTTFVLPRLKNGRYFRSAWNYATIKDKNYR